MKKQDRQQLSLDLCVRGGGNRTTTEEEPQSAGAGNAEIRSLSEARIAKEKEEAARHFREILRLARHY